MEHPPPLPALPGAYGLLMVTSRPLALSWGRGRTGRLAPGLHAYCGSAGGPGGIRARVARHLGRAKRHHWHIDQLTERAKVIAVLCVVGGDECVLWSRLKGELEGAVPAPGFGSSDCRTCPSHLLSWPRGHAPALTAFAGYGDVFDLRET